MARRASGRYDDGIGQRRTPGEVDCHHIFGFVVVEGGLDAGEQRRLGDVVGGRTQLYARLAGQGLLLGLKIRLNRSSRPDLRKVPICVPQLSHSLLDGYNPRSPNYHRRAVFARALEARSAVALDALRLASSTVPAGGCMTET